MPAYNCKYTVKNAIGSVLRQSFSDFELIIADDGSTDGTSELLDETESECKEIKVLHGENGGPGAARNAGISAASGDYILFLDSDDEFMKYAFEVISENLSSDSCDMFIFGFKQRFFGKAPDRIYSYEGEPDIDILYENNLLNQVWNKAFKREFLIKNNILFGGYRYGEDRLFNGDCLEKKPEISVIPYVLYNYNIDDKTSLISGYVPEKFDACKEIYERFSRLCVNRGTADKMFLKNILSCLTVLYADNCPLTNEEKVKEADRILNDESVKKAMSEKQDSASIEIIRRIINTKKPGLNLKFARAVSDCQKNLLPVFLKFRG